MEKALGEKKSMVLFKVGLETFSGHPYPLWLWSESGLIPLGFSEVLSSSVDNQSLMHVSS